MKFNITMKEMMRADTWLNSTDLPGCLSEGETLEETVDNISEAIIGCLKSRLKFAGERLKIQSFDDKLDISIDLTEQNYAKAS